MAIERRNRSLKEFVSGRVRMGLSEFLTAVGSEFQFVSNEAAGVPFLHEPTLQRPEWGQAQVWLKEVGHLVTSNAKKSVVIVPSGRWMGSYDIDSTKELTKPFFNEKRKAMAKRNKNFPGPTPGESFKEYAFRYKAFFVLRLLEEPPLGPNHFRCNCSYFFRYAQCKHSLGVSILFKLCEVPGRWIVDSIRALKKRGRPADVGHCLKK
jgi:hypothetical protein